MDATHTISGTEDENVEEGLSSSVSSANTTNKITSKKASVQPQNVKIKTVNACSEGCVPIPCMYHTIGKMIVWLGPKRPYDLKWPFNEEFYEETIFKTPEELILKINNLENNQDLYKKCLENQQNIFNKYLNIKWIKEYIINMSYVDWEGFKAIFDVSVLNYTNHGSHLQNFRDTDNQPMLYAFCINGGKIDNESLNQARNINKELYEKFMNSKKKGLTGYKGIEDKYEEFDDLDSKHILILTILFNNNISFKNIVEIGGGYGNCIRLSENIIKYDKWSIIDLPHMLDLQTYFLKNQTTFF